MTRTSSGPLLGLSIGVVQSVKFTAAFGLDGRIHGVGIVDTAESTRFNIDGLGQATEARLNQQILLECVHRIEVNHKCGRCT